MNKVSVGPSSILGWLTFAAGEVTAVVSSIEHNQALMTGQNKPAAIAGLIALVATNVGRQFQAAVGPSTEEPEQSFQPPDSAVTPDVPTSAEAQSSTGYAVG